MLKLMIESHSERINGSTRLSCIRISYVGSYLNSSPTIGLFHNIIIEVLMRNWYMYTLLLLLLTGCASVKTYDSPPRAYKALRDSLPVISADSEEETVLGYIMKGDMMHTSQYRSHAWSIKEEWLIRFQGKLGYVDRRGFPLPGSGYSTWGNEDTEPRPHAAVYYFHLTPYIVSDSLLVLLDPVPSKDTLAVLKVGDTVLVREKSYSSARRRLEYTIQYKGESLPVSYASLLTTADYEYKLKEQADPTAEDKNSGSSSSGHTWQTGKRGGQYYINKNGNKTYKKK